MTSFARVLRLSFCSLSFCTILFSASVQATDIHLWSQRFGDTSYDQGEAVATDASGNVIMTGYFSGTVDFGGGNLPSGAYSNIFLAKYNGNGVHLWSHGFSGAGPESGEGVAVDGSDNIIVTGRFNSTVNFGGGDLTSAGTSDVFLAKYDANGEARSSSSGVVTRKRSPSRATS